MTRHTLHVPLRYNDNSHVPPSELALIEGRLLDLAGGFTATTAAGAWRSPDGRVYAEPIQLYHVDTDDDIATELRELAELVAVRMEQEAVYLTATEVDAQLVTAAIAA